MTSPAETQGKSESFAKKTVKGAAWTYMAYVLNKLSGFIMTLILTRLIIPEQYGIVGFALTAISFFDAIRDLGVGAALIQRRENIEEAANTAFWLNLVSNFVFWLLMTLGAPAVADFFREPLLVVVLPIISTTFILTAIGGIHEALLTRSMQFQRRIIPEMASSFSKALFSIGLALILPDAHKVWAVVLGQVIGRIFWMFLMWAVNPWRPKLAFKLPVAGQMLNYGYKISLDSLISALQANIDYVFIGRFLGDTALGIYFVAFRVPELIIINFANVVAGVLFPAYAELEDRAKLKTAILGTLRYVALITVPAGIGLALISPLFAEVVFDPAYIDAGPMMALLSLYGMLLAVSWNIGDVYKAIARADILWRTSFIEMALLGIVLYFMAQISALHVAFGHVCVAFIVSLMRLLIAIRLLELDWRQTFAQFTPSVVGSAIMGAAVWLTLQVFAALPGVALLGLAILAGAVVYGASMWWLERPLVVRVVELIQDWLPERETETA